MEVFHQDLSRPPSLPSHDASSPTLCTSLQSTPPRAGSLEAPSPIPSPPPLNQDQEQSQPLPDPVTLERDGQLQGHVTKTFIEEEEEEEEEGEKEEHRLQRDGKEQPPAASPSLCVQQGEQENDREAEEEPEPEEDQQQDEVEELVSPVMELDPSLDLEVMELMTSGSPPPTSLLHLPSPSPPPFTRRGKGRSLRPQPSTSSCRPSDDLAIRLRQSPFSTEASPETSPAREPVTPPPLSPPSPPRRETAPLAKVRERERALCHCLHQC